jgi:lipopolysaccharide/colanic/teichoic acid biosynthesis glycosyltransferase
MAKLSQRFAISICSGNAVRPGITGWAQVNGHRGILVESQDLTVRVDYDIFYIQNRSLMFDVRIVRLQS